MAHRRPLLPHRAQSARDCWLLRAAPGGAQIELIDLRSGERWQLKPQGRLQRLLRTRRGLR